MLQRLATHNLESVLIGTDGAARERPRPPRPRRPRPGAGSRAPPPGRLRRETRRLPDLDLAPRARRPPRGARDRPGVPAASPDPRVSARSRPATGGRVASASRAIGRAPRAARRGRTGLRPSRPPTGSPPPGRRRARARGFARTHGCACHPVSRSNTRTLSRALWARDLRGGGRDGRRGLPDPRSSCGARRRRCAHGLPWGNRGTPRAVARTPGSVPPGTHPGTGGARAPARRPPTRREPPVRWARPRRRGTGSDSPRACCRRLARARSRGGARRCDACDRPPSRR